MNTPFTNTPSDIFHSWIALEVLSPQTFRKPQDLAGADGSIVQLENPVLPWEGVGEKSKPKHQLYYQVVLGSINFEKAVAALLDVYADKRVERPSPKGDAILGVIVVDNKGFLVKDPAIYISSFAWALPQALKKDLSNLSEWTNAEDKLRIALDKIMRRTDEEGNELALDSQTLKRAIRYLLNTLELPVELFNNQLFAVRTHQYYTNPEPPDPLFLNSFYIGDLLMANSLFKAGKATSNLKRYIGLKQQGNRKDLLHDRKAFEESIAPGIMSAARWPGPGRHPLVVLQQAAVNLTLKELKKDGILAVNGPPGTGKTTLLRDILAGIIADRAQAMCTFDDPGKAFVNSGQRLSAGQAWLTLYEVDTSLKGFEVLIASSNNKAVENISAELPGLKAIANDIDDLRYFKCLSDALLDNESWGIIAAVLGNASNRSRFRQTFWWDKEVGLSTYLAEAAGTPQVVDVIDKATRKITRTGKPRIVEQENAPGNRDEALERWRKAKDRFKNALAISRSKLATLEELRKKIISLSSLKQEKALTKVALEQALSGESSAASDVTASEQAHAQYEKDLNLAEENLSDHLKVRPGFFARLFNDPPARSWKTRHLSLTERTITARQRFADSHAQLVLYRNNLAKYTKTVRSCEAALSRLSNKLSAAQQAIENARNNLGPHIIDSDFFSLQHEEQHIVSPWCDKNAQRLRDDVFIEAIRLHKAFIDAAAKPIRHNLGALMTVFSGRSMPDEKKEQLLPDLWATLFLVVPGVSTTFASVERMLGKLPPESLGWLLIDEAGQALPQAAVGAITRTRRAVVVGDPIQIEPVVTLPATLTQQICRQFGIDPDRFNAPEASVQTLADAATPYYAEFEGKHGSRNVGVPLLVHRRCEEPMFGISNTIAYERLMVQAKKPGNSPIRDFLGTSRWIDVKGQAIDKWCPEEGAVVIDLLQRLRDAVIAPDLYIVTPFVIVADNLRKIVLNSGVLTSWVENDRSWVNERIGTVHTVQGREAECVLFVLGAPLPEQSGARAWAGGSPNLLNVAVTRAKEVLYVVGNRKLWQNAGLFATLSDRMP